MYKVIPRETVIFLREDGLIPGWPSQVVTRNFGMREDVVPRWVLRIVNKSFTSSMQWILINRTVTYSTTLSHMLRNSKRFHRKIIVKWVSGSTLLKTVIYAQKTWCVHNVIWSCVPRQSIHLISTCQCYPNVFLRSIFYEFVILSL